MSKSIAFAAQPLLAAELHYFRVARGDWELMLARMRQIGANTIATPVPWAWHEPQPGALDLHGGSHPQRDLAGFVRLCGRLGFRVILKPGPCGDDDMLGAGVPPWLLRERPEIHALRPDGQPWHHAQSGAPYVCALHPAYLEHARRWIAAFSAAALDLQAPAGPIVALQASHQPTESGRGDPRLKLDFNEYVLKTLWPRWLAEAVVRSPLPGALGPISLDPPTSLEELRRRVALNLFSDWLSTTALATIVGWLRDDGWATPIYHSLPAAPWRAGAIADPASLARATGWLGHSIAAEATRSLPGGETRRQIEFEAYVDYAHWRTRLVARLSPGMPAWAAESSLAHDFGFAAPFVGGLQAISVSAGPQIQPDNPGIGAGARQAMAGPVRPDGSVRPRFWNAKAPLMLLELAGADFATARAPAELALGYSHAAERIGDLAGEPDARHELGHLLDGCDHAARAQVLAQRLVRANIAFDVIDLDTATPEELARYRLVIAPAAAALASATQSKLAGCANLALVGSAHTRYDERLEPCSILDDAEQALPTRRQGDKETRSDCGEAPAFQSPGLLVSQAPLRLPEDVSGEQIGELVEQRGGTARYAWADGEDVDVSLRHGDTHTYLFVANRRPAPYSGTLSYRAADGSIQHLHIGMGGPRVGIVIISGDDVLGAAIGGDGAEGGWLARGMHSSVVFNNGAGVVAPCGGGLLFSAPQSGRFQVRRPGGWDGMAARRLLLSGALLPAAHQTDSAHLALPYTAEDQHGQTDAYLLLAEGEPLPEQLRAHTTTLLLARAATLRRAATLAGEPALEEHAEARAAVALAAELFGRAASDLEALAGRAYTLDEYGAAWQAAGTACEPAIERLALALARARGEHLAGALDAAIYAGLEQRLSQLLGVVSRGSLAHDRE